MFTGIVEATAAVLSYRAGVLKVRRPKGFTHQKEGSSIAVAGACLTVTALTAKAMAFDVVPETVRKTTLSALKAGDRVNLERAMRADGRFEGHVVQGHVEGVGEVLAVYVPSSIPRPLSPEEKGERPHRGLTPSGVLRFSREMRRNPTEAEKEFWEVVRQDKLGVRFRRQYRFGYCIVDFFIPALRLAIEIDGDYHDNKKQAKEDALRTKYLEEAFGIRIIRFRNDQVMKHLDRVMDRLRSIMKEYSPSPPERGAGGEEGKESLLTIRAPKNLINTILPKGSITLDGVSLTVADVSKESFSVALIPTTLRKTTLGALRKGDRVNIETDILGRYVRSFLPRL